MHKPLIQILPLILLMILLSAIQIRSQEITPKPENGSVKTSRQIQNVGDDCAAMLDKTLDAFEKSQTALTLKTAENQTNIDLRRKEEIYNEELLKAVALLTSAERRNKSFFEKLRQQLGRVLQSATDPKTIGTIISVILIADRLKR